MAWRQRTSAYAYAPPPVIAPLVFTPETLTANQGAAFSQSVSPQVSGGVPPYTFTLVSQSGPDTFAVSSVGTITGTPLILNARVTSSGAYRVDSLGNLRVVVP